MRILFWVSAGMVGYAYLGYPLLVFLASTIRGRPPRRGADLPSVSVIIAARNEERAIEHKLENCLALDYPRDRLEIIVASDASTDGTERIVQGYADRGVRLVRQDVRSGKTGAQNLAVRHASGEILVFSDATTTYRPDAARKLVRNFADPTVGGVGGELIFVKPQGTRIGEEVSLFFRYERSLREWEGSFNTLTNVSGCIYAVRRQLHRPLPEALIDDFATPLVVADQGYRVVYDREAIAHEHTTLTWSQEFRRKVRIVVGGIHGLRHMRHLLNPLRSGWLAWQLASHKICRWLAPGFLLLLLATSLGLLRHWAGIVVTSAQLAVYGLGVVGFLGQRGGRRLPRLVRVCGHFCMLNLAALVGVIQYLRGERNQTWEPIR